jgi:hypothetical protein
VQLSFLSNLFKNALISKRLDAQGRGSSHFLLLFQEIPFHMVIKKESIHRESRSTQDMGGNLLLQSGIWYIAECRDSIEKNDQVWKELEDLKKNGPNVNLLALTVYK